MTLLAPDLEFSIEGAHAVEFAASPRIALKLRITCDEAVPIHSVLLRCQIHLEATRCHYQADEKPMLSDLFGDPSEWDRTLHNLHWTNVEISIPGFSGSTVVDLPVECSYDFNLAATKLFDALQEGEVPLCLLFSGTIFYVGTHEMLRIGQIPWHKEAEYRLPVRVWHEMMKSYYGDTAFVPLQKEVFDQLLDYKRRHALPTWEQAIESLLNAKPEPATLPQ